MFIVCWSVKGGVGTTTVTASLGVVLAQSPTVGSTTIVDLGGDVPAAFNIPAATGPGVVEWLAAPNAPPGSLLRLAAPVMPGLGVVHLGGSDAVGRLSAQFDAESWRRIGAECASASGADIVLVDAGQDVPPQSLQSLADRSLLVVRACYLVLRRVALAPSGATGVVLIAEPGRFLRTSDVEIATGLPVVAEIPWDPSMARCMDGGLLSSRLPQAATRALRRVAVTEMAR